MKQQSHEVSGFLLVFLDGKARQLKTNLSITDVLAASQGILVIFRFYKENFQRLLKDELNYQWVDVPLSERGFTSEGPVNL